VSDPKTLFHHPKSSGRRVIPPQYVRNEQDQADHLADMLSVFSGEGFLGASPYHWLPKRSFHAVSAF
jgi:hypothetical protein